MEHQVYNSIGSHIYNGICYNGYDHDYNFHNSFEIVYVMNGQCTAVVSSDKITLTAEDFFLISPNVSHAILDTKDCNFFIGIFTNDLVMEFFKNGHTSSYYRFRVNAETEAYLKTHMLFTGTPEFYCLKSCLYAICSNAVTNSDIRGGEVDPSFIFAVNDYIAKHLTTNFTRYDIATALNYEEHYFSYIFNKTFLIGFKQYVNAYRINLAQRLLTTTEQKIVDIAFDCGFTSIRSFNRVFKQFTGKAPNEFRNSNLNSQFNLVVPHEIITMDNYKSVKLESESKKFYD